MKNTDLSIIIPVYNGEQYINKCLDSILKTRKYNVEIIVIDDYSNDNTSEILKTYANIKVITLRENKGISYCRNLGIVEAKGKYIGFVDSDDYVTEGMYEKLLKQAYQYDLDICGCNYVEIFNDGVVNSKYHYDNEILGPNNLIKKVLTDQISSSICDKIYRASIVKSMKFEERLRVAEDILFNLSVMIEADKAFMFDEVYYTFVRHINSVTQSISCNLLQFRKLEDYISKDNKNYLSVDFQEEYEYFRGAMIIRAIHAVSFIADRHNKEQVKVYLNRLINRQKLKNLLDNKYTEIYLKIEIRILLLLGANMYLLVMPLYKFLRKRIRNAY